MQAAGNQLMYCLIRSVLYSWQLVRSPQDWPQISQVWSEISVSVVEKKNYIKATEEGSEHDW